MLPKRILCLWFGSLVTLTAAGCGSAVAAPPSAAGPSLNAPRQPQETQPVRFVSPDDVGGPGVAESGYAALPEVSSSKVRRARR